MLFFDKSSTEGHLIMKKVLTTSKRLAIISLSIIIANQYIIMTTQASPTTIKRSVPLKTMNESEAAIIKDIKQACLYVVSQSISPEEVAAKFGTPIQEPMNAHEVEPFNPSLKIISTDVSFDSKHPLATDTINFTPKPGKISIETLRQEFGSYSHTPPDGPFALEIVRFDTKVIYNGVQKDCEILVEYKRTEDRFQPVDVKNENIELITVIFSDVIL